MLAQQMKSKIDTVGKIRHRNLLPLLAHISRPDGDYLVYEYTSNGSLLNMLKKIENGECNSSIFARFIFNCFNTC